jgi:glycosyltransferase involved in cell wall biosynthesis
MRIIYYSLPGLLEHVPSQVKVLSRHAELHVVFEAPPKAWQHNLLDLPYPSGPCGFREGRIFLQQHLPKEAWRYFQDAAGIYFAKFPRGVRWSSIGSMFDVLRGITNINPDIVYLDGESIRAAFWAPLVRRPLLINVHEPTVPTGSRSLALSLAKRILIPRADHIIVHSDVCKSLMLERWHLPVGKVSKVALGPMEIFRAWWSQGPGSRDADREVLFWGRLTPRKGVDVLLRAAFRVSQRIEQVKFVIAGETVGGYVLPPLPELANGGVIQVIDRRLTNSELAERISRAALVVAPYRDAMQSGVVLAAYAFGRPVVVSDAGGLVEQVCPGSTGMVFQSDNAEDLAQSICTLLLNREERLRMQSRIRDLCASTLSWEHFSSGIFQVFQKLAGDSSATN